MTLSELAVRDLITAFRSPEPTPGGGSAAALAGAVGAALLAMVASLGRPRASTPEDLSRLSAAGRRCSELSQELTTLIDRDSDAYMGVVEAYRAPKATEQESRARSSRIQEALLEATASPLEVMRLCADAIEQAGVVAALGNRNASSDVQSGLELLTAGLRAATSNVEINLSGLKDAERCAAIRGEASRLAAEAGEEAAAARRQLVNDG
jgi:formiminotetrahydrofolate cyclodeaminase